MTVDFPVGTRNVRDEVRALSLKPVVMVDELAVLNVERKTSRYASFRQDHSFASGGHVDLRRDSMGTFFVLGAAVSANREAPP